MGEVAIGSLAAQAKYIRLLFALSSEKFRLLFACPRVQERAWKRA
jgi:hypothetical protein